MKSKAEHFLSGPDGTIESNSEYFNNWRKFYGEFKIPHQNLTLCVISNFTPRCRGVVNCVCEYTDNQACLHTYTDTRIHTQAWQAVSPNVWQTNKSDKGNLNVNKNAAWYLLLGTSYTHTKKHAQANTYTHARLFRAQTIELFSTTKKEKLINQFENWFQKTRTKLKKKINCDRFQNFHFIFYWML